MKSALDTTLYACGINLRHLIQLYHNHRHWIQSILINVTGYKVGVDVCVDCACEEDRDDCDDAKVPLLVDRAITFKALPLHRQKYF